MPDTGRKREKVNRSRAPLLHVERPAEKPLTWTRTVRKLNEEGDYIVIVRDGYRQISGSLIEAKYAKEELKGEEIGIPQNLGKVSRTAPKATPEKEIVIEGNKVVMSAKELRKEVIAGNMVFTKAGKKIPMTKRAEQDPNKKYNVIIKIENKLKHFHLT